MATICTLFPAATQLCAVASTGSDKGLTLVSRGNDQGVGRGCGVVPARPGQDVSSGTFALTADPLGVDWSRLTHMDGRKRPISSPPLQRPSQSKKNKPPSDSGQCSDLSRDDKSQSLMKRIDEFIDPLPCAPLLVLCGPNHTILSMTSFRTPLPHHI